jgi:NAD(P)-dependent dehydrogenase (short-subunit alcohol dehydrogenase family)
VTETGEEPVLAGRVAVVTGAARGLGAAYTAALAEAGARVVAADVDADGARRTARRTGGLAVTADVSSPSDVDHLFATTGARFGRLDILVNNAAVMLDVERPFKPFWEISVDEWDRVMAVNARSVFLCCARARPLMAESGGGSVINITSDAIWHGYEGQLAYFASKGAVAVMNRCLARELGQFGIRVNAIAPGLTQSEAVRSSEFLQQLGPAVRRDRALGRDQDPRDLVGTVLFLAGPSSSAITGQTIVVNCGGIMP